MTASRSARTSKKAGYHHGDLPSALVDAAVEIISSGGVEGLTVAAAAKRVGVSHAAVYRHFADKRELLLAVAERGAARLGKTMQDAVASAPNEPRDAFLHVGRAVVRFAVREPVLYAVMFSSAKSSSLGDLTSSGPTTPFGMLRDFVSQLQAEGLLRPGSPTAHAVTIWATTHGLAMLASSGQLVAPWRTLADHVDAVHENLLLGLALPRR